MKHAFGIADYSMLPKINRLLKEHDLKLRVKSDRKRWGDQVQVSVEPLCSLCKGARRVKKPDGLGSMACPECQDRKIEDMAREARRTGFFLGAGFGRMILIQSAGGSFPFRRKGMVPDANHQRSFIGNTQGYSNASRRAFLECFQPQRDRDQCSVARAICQEARQGLGAFQRGRN